MKEWSLTLLTALLLVTNVGHGEDLNDGGKDKPHAKTVDLLRKISQIKDPDYDKAASENGGVHSGGGNLVLTAQGMGMLDLYLYNRPAFFSKEKGFVLAETRSFKYFGIDRLGRNNMPLFERTLAQIDKWAKSSPFVTRFLRAAVIGLPMYYVNYRLGYADQLAYVPPESGIKRENMQLAAFYLADFGCFVDKKSFDSLSLYNQMALLIHEALRQEQLSFHHGLSNENIQRLTAAILRDPQAGETLDDKRFFSDGLPKALNREFLLMERAEAIIKLYCEKLQSNCDLDPKRLTITDETAKQTAAKELSGQSLLDSLMDNLYRYRHMHSKSQSEVAETNLILLLTIAQFSDLGSKESDEIQKKNHRQTDMSFTKMLQGTDSLDLYLSIYNNNNMIEDYFANFQENANIKTFMREMKKAGYFK